MKSTVSHDVLDAALRHCGANWDAAQSHGLLSGRLAIAGVDAGFDWLGQVLGGSGRDAALRAECEGLLRALFETTYRQLAERQSQFEPLLPDEEESAEIRAAALARWCEGFLHGLVSADHGTELKARLAADPLAEVIRDLLQITRATVEADSDEDANEAAYAELVEYLRVAAQLTYEELVDFRHDSNGAGAVAGSEVVH